MAAPLMSVYLYSTTEIMKTKTIPPHFNTVFNPAAGIASCIIHQLLVIYSLQLLASLQIHTFYAVLSLQLLSGCHCSMAKADLNIFFPFMVDVDLSILFRLQAFFFSFLMNDA